MEIAIFVSRNRIARALRNDPRVRLHESVGPQCNAAVIPPLDGTANDGGLKEFVDAANALGLPVLYYPRDSVRGIKHPYPVANGRNNVLPWLRALKRCTARPPRPEIPERKAPPQPVTGAQYDVLFTLIHPGIGWGGGNLSQGNLAAAMRMRGYRVQIIGADLLADSPPKARAYILPGNICCSRKGRLVETLRECWPDAVLIQFVDNVLDRHINTDWSAFDAVICNSEFTRRRILDLGGPDAPIQTPILNPAYSRVDGKVKGEYVLSLNLTEARGGEIFKALAALMPETEFRGVYPPNDDRSVNEPIQETHNLTILPFRIETRDYYRAASALVLANQPGIEEAYGRVVAEALGNGIPVVATATGEIPNHAQRVKGMVFTVPEDAPVKAWHAALVKALKVRRRKRWQAAWHRDASPLLSVLNDLDVEPQQERQAFVINCYGGIGDVIGQYPVLRALTKVGTVYHMGRIRDKCAAAYQVCPYVQPGPPPAGAIPLNIGPLDHRDAPVCWGQESRNVGYERRNLVVVDEWRWEFAWKPEVMATAAARLPNNGKRNLGLALNAADAYQMRSMPFEAQEALASALERLEDWNVLVLHSRRSLGDGANRYDLGGRTSAVEALHLIHLLDAFIGVDSGLAHVAAACRIPAVFLMGAVGKGGHIRFTEGYGHPNSIELCRNLDCQPCWHDSKYGCNKPGRCLAFDPDEVLSAFREVVDNAL